MGLLSPAQLQQFAEQGYLLISGLMPPDVAERAETTMWQALGRDPQDRSTWKEVPFGSGQTHPDILACFTPEMALAANELSGEERPFRAPQSTFALNVFPQEGEWAPHGPHIDHAIQKDNYRTFPRPMRLASLIYLSNVQPHGGGTVVWPGSHKKIEALAQSDPEHYALMYTLNQAIPTLDLGEPVEILGKRGDILFYHYLCAHSGSRNVADYPRFALAYKW